MGGMHPLRKSATAVALAAAALAPPPRPTPVRPPPRSRSTSWSPTATSRSSVGHASGVQIYPCLSTASGYAWGPSTPRATLVDDNGKPIVEHFGGPSWQANDGSLVVGRRDAGVTVDPTAIPWLRLTIASATAGQDGDRLVATTYIQRTATTGGLTPRPQTATRPPRARGSRCPTAPTTRSGSARAADVPAALDVP